MITKTEDEYLNNINKDSSYVVRQSDRCLLYDFSGLVRFESLFEGRSSFR